MGIFVHLMERLAAAGTEPKTVMIVDATDLKAHRTASSLAKKGGFDA